MDRRKGGGARLAAGKTDVWTCNGSALALDTVVYQLRALGSRPLESSQKLRFALLYS